MARILVNKCVFNKSYILKLLASDGEYTKTDSNVNSSWHEFEKISTCNEMNLYLVECNVE